MSNLPVKVEDFVRRLEQCECTDIQVSLIQRSGNYSIRCTLSPWYPFGTWNVGKGRNARWTYVVHNGKFQGEYKRPVSDPARIASAKRIFELEGYPVMWWEQYK